MKNVIKIAPIAMVSALLVLVSSCKNETAQEERSLVVEKEIAKVETTMPAAKGYAIGDEARNFNLKNIDNTMVSLTDYPEAKGFIVIFTCNTCPFAVASEDRIIALDAEFKDKGYPVIAINPNDPAVQPDDTFELIMALHFRIYMMKMIKSMPVMVPQKHPMCIFFRKRKESIL